jgi:hypothetical protein
MRALRYNWAAIMGLLLAAASVAGARAEQLKPAEPPAQLQQTVPATPEPANSASRGNATTTPPAQIPAPVAPRPVTSQTEPAVALAPARQ